MRVQSFVAAVCCALASVSPAVARAQAADTTGGPELTLETAVALALKNNPEYLQRRDQLSPAAARVRSAYGAFVPNAGVSLTGGYLAAGGITVSGVPGLSTGSDQIQSQYAIGLSYNLSTATFVNPSLQSANLRATENDITSSANTLRRNVSDAYLLVLVDQANAALQDSLIVSNQVQVDLARAKMQAGSGTQLDLSRALVGLGNQRIAAIRANNQVQVDLLLLYEFIGVPQPPGVRLTTRIGVRPPGFGLDSVLRLARASNPRLISLQQSAIAAGHGVTAAKGNFLPSLSANAGWGGYANQYTNQNYPVTVANSEYTSAVAQCNQLDSIYTYAGMPPLTPSCASIPPPNAEAIKAQNNAVKGWNFTSAPFTASVTLSLTVLDGLQRITTLETAKAFRNDAEYNVRSEELLLTADVTSAYLTLQAAIEAERLARENMDQARLALRLAEERYRVGSSTAVDLSTQRDDYQRAVSQLLTSTFDFHRAFAALELAVGRPLR